MQDMQLFRLSCQWPMPKSHATPYLQRYSEMYLSPPLPPPYADSLHATHHHTHLPSRPSAHHHNHSRFEEAFLPIDAPIELVPVGCRDFRPNSNDALKRVSRPALLVPSTSSPQCKAHTHLPSPSHLAIPSPASRPPALKAQCTLATQVTGPILCLHALHLPYQSSNR